MPSCLIFLTGDMHNRLTASGAARLKALRSGEEDSLLLDSGDAIGAGNLTPRLRGEPILRLMGESGYDAMAMGNREAHPTRSLLARKLAGAPFPILAANLMAKRQPAPPQVRSHLERRLPNGVRIAVLGLAPQVTAPDSWWSRVTDYVFDDPVKTAGGLARKLAAEADLVVALSHCGIETDRALARLAELQLVLGGHSHRELYEAPSPGAAAIVHPGFSARKVARISLELAPGQAPVPTVSFLSLEA
jgi:2',3'-cyclic-nucleotide 2'-phosphodiesterase (5'-nucleotidase family)